MNYFNASEVKETQEDQGLKQAYFALMENDLEKAKAFLDQAYKIFPENDELKKLIAIYFVKKYPISDAYTMCKNYFKEDKEPFMTAEQFMMAGRCIKIYNEIKVYLDKIEKNNIPCHAVNAAMFNKIMLWWKSTEIYQIKDPGRQLISYVDDLFLEDIAEEIIQIGQKQAEEAQNEGRYEQAHKIYDWLIEHMYRDDEAIKLLFVIVYLNKQSLYEKERRYEESLKCFEKSMNLGIETGIEASSIWFEKARILNSLSRFEEAFECCQKGLMLDPDPQAEIWNVIGWTYQGLKNYEKALESFDKALEKNPNDLYGWSNKSSVYIEMKDYQKALECGVEQTKLYPYHATGWNNRGVALEYLKRYEEALECYTKAVNYDPRHDVFWANKGNVLYKLNKFGEALECYEKSLTINENNNEAWLGKGQVYYEQEKYEEALECCNKALLIDNEEKETWEYKGKILLKLGQEDEAKLCFEKKEFLEAQKP